MQYYLLLTGNDVDIPGEPAEAGYRVFGQFIQPNVPTDVERGLLLPAGTILQHATSAAANTGIWSLTGIMDDGS